MKKIYTLALSLATLSQMNAQVVFSSSFELWGVTGVPADWMGSKTTLESDSIAQITSGVQYGSNAVQLINKDASQHKRFTTQPVHTDSATTYDVKMWVKGAGDVRMTLFDNRTSGSGYATYSAYSTVSSTTWQMLTFSFTSVNTYDSSQFVISMKSTMAPDQLQIDSFVVSVGTTASVALKDIYDIQYTTAGTGDSPLKDSTVMVTGIVTAVKGSGYYLQDAWAAWSGIYVYDPANTPARGDSITIVATVDEYFNATQLENVTSFTNHASGKSTLPINVSTFGAGGENNEGVLVSVSGVCTDDDIANNFGMWKVNDSSGEVLVDDQLFAYTPVLNNSYDVTGVVDYSFSEYKILPRDANDVNVSTGIASITMNEVRFYPNPVKNTLTIENANNVMVRIFSVLGEEVFASVINQTIDMSSFENGVYVVEVSMNNVVSRKQVIKN